jgi:predicted acetyltransferase
VARLRDEADPAWCAAAGRACATYRWIVEQDQVLGAIALRHELDGSVPALGHIGYGIRPAARRRGLATWAVGQILDEAWLLGLRRVKLICRADDLASIRTIERNGGVLEAGHPSMRRYWITSAAASG